MLIGIEACKDKVHCPEVSRHAQVCNNEAKVKLQPAQKGEVLVKLGGEVCCQKCVFHSEEMVENYICKREMGNAGREDIEEYKGMWKITDKTYPMRFTIAYISTGLVISRVISI